MPEGVRVAAPIYTGTTPYVRFGDWIGQVALLLGLVGHLGLWYAFRMKPKRSPRRYAMRRLMGTPGS